jgi:D-beta-D-heptose 7-phosphate kinase/D-beta-D-heptose 1-phosphate adenosyltransferase
MIVLEQKVVDFSKARVLVVGDVMLDRYWHGPVSRISPEAPVPVVKVDQLEDRVGGAGNVALNAAELGASVTLLAVTGKDKEAEQLRACLNESGINCELQQLSTVPTVAKLRVISQHQQLIRLDFEEPLAEHIDQAQLLSQFEKLLNQADVVVLSDYGKGTLSNAQHFIQAANKAEVPVLVDPKSLDFADYQGATVVTPNFKEFTAVVGAISSEAELTAKGQNLINKHGLTHLLITRGAEGMTLLSQATDPVSIPTKAQEVYDVTGAGDTVIAALATGLACGLKAAEAMHLANTAAGVTVGKLGSATVSEAELRTALREERCLPFGVLTEEKLKEVVAEAKANGERVVMTNGCFDILHAGHVHYLNEAKALGDRLIVAVNDDASVTKLKGPSRPINPLERRMAVLAGLASADWVVPFSEETPQRLISEVLPNVLVKGGDYKVEEIAGHKEVLANGGSVEILGFVEGLSTSAVVEQLSGEKR